MRKVLNHQKIYITESKEFGVSLTAIDQTTLASVAGTTSGFKVDKINLLKELGFKFYKAKNIKALMVEGAALNAECKLVKAINIGSHTIFIGEVLEASKKNDKEPLAYHNGKFWKMTDPLPKPSQEERKRIEQFIERYKRN